MSITLASIFDDRDEAARARERLIEAGFADGAISLDSSGQPATAGTASDTHEPKRRSFFARLFGLDDDDADDHAGHYAEAVRRGSVVLALTLDDESRVDEAARILDECGAVDIDRRIEQWRAGGYGRYDEAAPPYDEAQVREERERLRAGAQPGATAGDVLPVVEEDLKVGKREVERGRVRVHRRLLERPVQEQVTLREEHAVVERRPVDRPAAPGDLDAFRDQTIELRETAEEPVVEKTARVVEEVRVGTEVSERSETIRDTVRRSDVEVESVDTPAAGRVPVYGGPERRVANDASYRGPERRRQVAMQ